MKKIYFIILLIFVIHPLMANNNKYMLSKIVYDTITKTQLYLDKNKYQDAKKLLLALDKSSKVRKKVDKAYLKFYIGYIYTLTNNESKAVSYFKKALALKALPADQIQNIRLNLAQLYMQRSDYYNALNYLKKLIDTGPVKAEYYIYEANANLALKRYASVIKNIDKAIALSKNKKPSWLKMKFYCYYMLKDYFHAITTAKELIRIEPLNKEYWIQLSALYSIKQKPLDALSTLDVANILKIDLNENELLQLIAWLSYMDIP